VLLAQTPKLQAENVAACVEGYQAVDAQLMGAAA
jgi:hypothetical protein